MIETIKEKWDEILIYAKDKYKISDVSFNTWVYPLQICSMDESSIVRIVVPDANFIGYIKKKYGPILKSSIEEISHIKCEIEFIIKVDNVDKNNSLLLNKSIQKVTEEPYSVKPVAESDPELVSLKIETIKGKWNEILMYAKEEYEISDVSFDTWLRTLQIYKVEVNSESLYEETFDPLIVKVFVPDENRIFINLIEEEYGWILQESIENVNRLTCNVEFITSNQIDSSNYKVLSKKQRKPILKECVFIERNSAVGKRILEIIKVNQNRKDARTPGELPDMADLVCEVFSYFNLPQKKLIPFSWDIWMSLFEQADNAEIMAVASAVYRYVYEGDVYMIDGKYYLAEFFRPRSSDGIIAWDNMLLALSLNFGMEDVIIRTLLINSYARAHLTCVSEIKQEMRDTGSLRAEFVIRLANTFDKILTNEGVYDEAYNIGKQKLDYVEADFIEVGTYFRENNRKVHEICPELKWFTAFMEEESIAVRYEAREGIYGNSCYEENKYVMIYAYDTKQNYTMVGKGAVNPYASWHNGYFTIMTELNYCYPYGENICPIHKNFKSIILNMVRKKLNKRERYNIMEESLKDPQLDFRQIRFRGLALKESISFEEWLTLVGNLKDFVEAGSIIKHMELENYISPEDFVVSYSKFEIDPLKKSIKSPGCRMKKHYCPAKYGAKTIAVINQNDYVGND